MQRGSQGKPRAEQKASQKTKEGDMQASSIGPQSDTSDVTRPKTAFTRKKPSIRERFRPQSATPSHSSGSVKRKEAESIGAEEHHTNNRALENEHFEREKEKADWEKRLDKENNKTKTSETCWANEMQKLKEQKEREFNESKTQWENYCEELNEKHTKEKEQLQKAIKRLTVEKDKLLTRLSTIASDRLTHENVNIADLSDADRPTKLQEVYSELYDNEWTDAFEELTKQDNTTDYDAIIILLKILMSSFQNCREITWGRYERLKNVASYIEQEISLQSPKVMSNVSKPVLTTRGAESSRAQLEKNEERVDQSAANGKVEMEDRSTIKASEDEITNEKGKTSDTDQNVDNMQEQTASRENGENKEMQNNAKDKVESSDTNEGKASSKDKTENKNGKKHAKESVQSGDVNVHEASKDNSENKKGKNSGKENEESGDPNVIGVLKDKFENNGAKENMESGDPIMSETSKDKFEKKTGKNNAKDKVESSDPNEGKASSKDKTENKNGKKHAKECLQSGDPNVSEASKDNSENKKGKKDAKDNVETSDPNEGKSSLKDKSENKNGKKDAKDNVESSDPNVSVASSNDQSENNNGKKHAKESVQSGDVNVHEASKDNSENKKGKNSGKENGESGDPNVIGASKDKFENNGAKENMESGDPIMSETSKDKFEKKTGKHLMCTIDLNFELTNEIKGIWRKTTLQLKGIAAEPLYSLIETCLDMPFTDLPLTSKYFKRCIDLCWKMGFQEKPLHLEGFAEMDAYAGKKFDKDKFRAYTRSGSDIAFVVWPTLYLYEGGPILVKGIAQCCSHVEATNEKLS